MEIEDIVMKLVGDIEPIGETNADNRALENLHKLTSVVDSLLANLVDVYKDNARRHEYSMKHASNTSKKFFDYLIEEYSEVFNNQESE